MTDLTGLTSPLYAAAAALALVLLGTRTLLLRRRFKTAIGPGESAMLERAIRAHGNFAEYVPTALLLLYFVEISGGGAVLVHALGLILLTGRFVHAYGISRVDENFAFRVAGMAMTFTVVISSALFLIAA